MSEVTQAIKDAFEQAASKGMKPDEIKVEMLKAGAEFSGINKLYNDLMVESGRMSDPKEKAKVVEEACESNDVSTKEGFEAAVEQILNELEGITQRSAEASVRGYCRKNEVECYKKPKTSKAGPGRTGFRKKFIDWLKLHPDATDEEINELLVTYGTKNVARHYSSFMELVNLVRDVHNGTKPEVEPEFEVPEEGNKFEDYSPKDKDEEEE